MRKMTFILMTAIILGLFIWITWQNNKISMLEDDLEFERASFESLAKHNEILTEDVEFINERNQGLLEVNRELNDELWKLKESMDEEQLK